MANPEANKRKCYEERLSSDGPLQPPKKRAKGYPDLARNAGTISHPLLSQLYPNLQTLRAYVLLRLPASSRLRRKKIAAIGLQNDDAEKRPTETELALADLLDTTVVGYSGQTSVKPDDRWGQWTSFSQKVDESYVSLSEGLAGGHFSQNEVVDFAVWLLFSREKKTGNRPLHLLCDGFRKDHDRKPGSRLAPGQGQIPGLFAMYFNSHVRALKEEPWPQLLLLMGQAGERIMLDLLLDCAIFSRVLAGKDNYHQLSGIPVSDLDYQPVKAPLAVPAHPVTSNKVIVRSPTEISLVRSRMLYARAALNARGLVHFGLRHIHILNRFPLKNQGRDVAQERHEVKHEESTTRVMMYIFPRQFGLHNVFTSQVDHTQTAQKFQDYTLREEEITKKFCTSQAGQQQFKAPIPKRLRGMTQDLVRKLQMLHSRCSYSMLLQHYCPAPGQSQRQSRSSQAKPGVLPKTQQKQAKSRKKARPGQPGIHPPPEYSSLIELATPVANVSAFCQAVLTKIIPNDFWGSKETQNRNRDAFLKKVDHFIRLRRFEQLSLHEVTQDLKLTDMDWLVSPSLRGQKSSLSETQKRLEILLEFVYYVYDSILIPLIRSNFYVTESNVHKYRLFFFRHDTWRYVAEPAMAALKTTMFEEVKLDDARRILDSRQLGFSQVRLLPKGLSMRPITNLRRRTLVKGIKKQLGPSINTVLGPVASMLRLEKSSNPRLLGSSMFSVGDIYKRLKDFKAKLGSSSQPLYLAKVDVTGAFDSIPQAAVIDLMNRIPAEREYKLVKHVEIKPSETSSTKPLKKWDSRARAPTDKTPFPTLLEEQLAPSKKNTVFIESVATRTHQTRSLMNLMSAHIQDNLVKIGKKFYRQKNGIPQGSVLSSTLCNYFYADLERKHLSFLTPDTCLLLRLIDDFLLITTSQPNAVRFVQTMTAGIPEYGVSINPDKTLINFDLTIAGKPVPRLGPNQPFPYCGTFINTKTLSITKSHSPAFASAINKGPAVFDSLTVEYARAPGATFKRKVLNSFKIQSHLMFFDTAHNSISSVLASIYSAYVETAEKTWAYCRCLPSHKRPDAKLVVGAIKELVVVSYLLLAGKERGRRWPGYEFGVRRREMGYLCLAAFKKVLGRRQAGYIGVLRWLEGEMERVVSEGRVDVVRLGRVAGR